MTAQNLSSPSLQICALLYYTEDSILFDRRILKEMQVEKFQEPFDSISNRYWGVMKGTWYGIPCYGVSINIIIPLINNNLLVRCEERNFTFYRLNVCEEHKEFFKEIKVQIALGLINISLK